MTEAPIPGARPPELPHPRLLTHASLRAEGPHPRAPSAPFPPAAEEAPDAA
ncbi:hypothetical protein EBL89_11470 [Cereibacter sphaeroides]|nr:hypothetical protein EBL89_11470 [Cereibacter sphaeroides]AZB60172.1 hypothetical protein EBL88_11415 [Cereibacter sphaeroides]